MVVYGDQTQRTQSSYISRLKRAAGVSIDDANNSDIDSSAISEPSTQSLTYIPLPLPPTTRDIAVAVASNAAASRKPAKQIKSKQSGDDGQRAASTCDMNPISGGCRVLINDPRQPEHFAGVSFSMYKRTQVKKLLTEAMTRGAIEDANYWGAELICCGCYLELWEVLFEFMSRNVGMSNPKMPVIIAKCFQDFKDTATSSEFSTNQLGMRNSSKVRKLMAKVISILCTSRKRGRLEYVKIDKENDFDILKLSSRMKAPSTDYSSQVVRSGDPTEVYVAINEICYHISKNVRNSLMADYWIEWLLEFDKRCRKKKERCQCERRDFAPQEDDGGKDVIFVVWDALLKEIKNRSQNTKAITTIMGSILELFKVRFTSGVKKKRRHLLYFAVSLLCEPLDLSVAAIQNETALLSVLENLDVVYTHVKQGETTTIPDMVTGSSKKSDKQKEMTEKEKKAAQKLDILTTMGVSD